ncbi:hypothetical protein N7447_005717 [Penicillium robsamsonii]|uniref:uncharacterized protein n=1 Tax=Penicillium robsamsonii TaxID=1792511 RepID=UPI002546C585|nr:uncharacterized protein N7447_005717 [Penicillium robsamsonii]KAJ5823377.1 hypothetical protein N7447_005717 [Penicillium robsamsonii]
MEDSVSIIRPEDIGLVLQSIFKSRKEVIRIRQLLHEKTDAIQCFTRHCGIFGAAPTEVGGPLEHLAFLLLQRTSEGHFDNIPWGPLKLPSVNVLL